MENKRLSKRAKLIIALVVLIALIGVFPIKEIILNPSIIGYSIFGYTITEVYVSGMEAPLTCTVELLEDWNLISIPCLDDNMSLNNVLALVSGEYYSIHTYIASNSTDKWKAYNPSLPSWVVQDLTEISEKQGYWINMKNDQTFNMEGVLLAPNIISLVEGWNLIGYPTNSSKDVVQAFISIYGSYTFVWMYNATEDRYYYYNATDNNGTFRDIAPYFGYWVKMDEDDELFTI